MLSAIFGSSRRCKPADVFAIACLFIAIGGVDAVAACKVKTKAVVEGVVAVPVAVSVGVPVAEVAPYYYSYQQYAPPQAADVDAIAARVVELLQARQGNYQTPPQPAASAAGYGQTSGPPAAAALQASHAVQNASLVEQRCAKCHSGASAPANLSFENLTKLTCEQKLKSVRAVLSEKMPKNGPRLTPDEAGRILEELTKP